MRTSFFGIFGLSALATLALGGCDDATNTTTTTGAGGSSTSGTSSASSGTGGAGEGLTWTPCSVVTGAADTKAECAETTAPVSYDAPDGPTIPLFVKRLPAKGVRRGQLWLLPGGPGVSGAGFEGFAKALASKDPTLDIYLLDHRGTGRSGRLGCDAEEADTSDGGYAITDAELPSCVATLKAEWGEKLAGFTTTNAARDLGSLIEKTRAPSDEVHLFGLSYGSDWALRFLSLYPSLATSVALDSFVTPDITLADLDGSNEDVGEQLLAACGADSLCSSKLGPDPWQKLVTTFDALDAGACPEAVAAGLTRANLTFLFGALLGAWTERSLIPATVYRLARCDAADIAALQKLAGLAFPSAAPPPATAEERLRSMLLQWHIGLSELWEEPAPPVADFQAFFDTGHTVQGVSLGLAAQHDAWPRYTSDGLHDAWPTTSTPLLILQGEFDAVTPLAVVEPGVKAHLAGPNQTFVVLPGGVHAALNSPPIGSCNPMLLAFMAHPTEPVDTSCVAALSPIEFAGAPGLASAVFGTPDLYENVAAITSGSTPGSAPSGDVESSAFAASLRTRVRDARAPYGMGAGR